ncbi:hypothetical protein AYI70_g10064, partial [Smittium culicis]
MKKDFEALLNVFPKSRASFCHLSFLIPRVFPEQSAFAALASCTTGATAAAFAAALHSITGAAPAATALAPPPPTTTATAGILAA